MKNIATIITSFILFAAVPVAFAWTTPPKNPPQDNAEAPITVADVDQNKQGKLGLGGLAVFGKFQLIDGTQGVGKVLVSDANGKASWAPMSGVGSGTTVSSGGQPIVCGGWDVKYGTSAALNEWGCATGASCPAGYDTIKSSKVTINLAEQTNLCVLSRAGGGGAAQWSNVSITGSSSFNNECEYRFKLDASIGTVTKNSYYYANVVDAGTIVYISHNQISHINSSSKNVYRVDGVPYYTVTQIQERCM